MFFYASDPKTFNKGSTFSKKEILLLLAILTVVVTLVGIFEKWPPQYPSLPSAQNLSGQ